MKLFIFIPCFLLLLIGSGSTSKGDEQGNTFVSPVNQLRYKGLTAAIAAPSEVQLHKSRSFSILIRVNSLDGQRLPERVTLRAFGKIRSGEEEGDYTLNVKLLYGVATAIISFPEITNSGTQSLRIVVASSDDPLGTMGVAEVKLLGAESIQITKTVTTLVADGKTTGKFEAIIKDQNGTPMEDVPCIIRYDIPGLRRNAVAGNTDSKGVVSFAMPAAIQEGKGSFQIEAEGLASEQVIVQYQLETEVAGG